MKMPTYVSFGPKGVLPIVNKFLQHEIYSHNEQIIYSQCWVQKFLFSSNFRTIIKALLRISQNALLQYQSPLIENLLAALQIVIYNSSFFFFGSFFTFFLDFFLSFLIFASFSAFSFLPSSVWYPWYVFCSSCTSVTRSSLSR